MHFYNSPAFFFKINLFYLFIYFCLCWVFVAARGLSPVAARGSYSLLPCAGFSLRWLLLLRSTGSRRSPAFLLHPPPSIWFLTLYFTSFCFVYPSTTYFGYRWFYYFLLALYMVDLLPLMYVCLYRWALVGALSSWLREVPLTFLVKLVGWC